MGTSSTLARSRWTTTGRCMAGSEDASALVRRGVGDALGLGVPKRERRGRQGHIGALMLFDEAPEPFRFEEFLELVASRLHLVPRYRQVLRDTPLGLTAPVWEDEQDFDLSFHVRHAGLPGAGGREQLEEYSARVFSRELESRKPLWELYIIEGLQYGGFALLTKTHRSLVDGMSAMAMTSVILDLSADEVHADPEDSGDPGDGYEPVGGADESAADGEAGEPKPRWGSSTVFEPWEPKPPASNVRLAVDELRETLTSPARLAASARRLVDAPMGTVRRLGDIGQGVVSVAASNLRERSRTTSLRRGDGLARRFVTSSLDLEHVKLVKNSFDTTVNDVVLAMVGDAIGRMLRRRGESTDGQAIRVMVPVSVASDDDQFALGNKVVAVFVDVPVGEMDPVHRLQQVAGRMADVKRSHHAVGARFLVDLGAYAPPTIHGMAARLVADPSLYDVIVTNVPGPDVPIWCLGARLRATHPYVPLPGGHALAVGVSSLAGGLHVGFTAGYDAVPNATDLAWYLSEACRELTNSASATSERAIRQRGVGKPDLTLVDGGQTEEPT